MHLKALTTLLLLFCTTPLWAQKVIDTAALRNLYDHCLDLDDDKADSLYHYSHYIDSCSKKLNYKNGQIFALRLKGIYYEFKNDYDNAVNYYLQSLTASRKVDNASYISCALSDLATVYASYLNQPAKAKEMYLQILNLPSSNSISSRVTNYINLGAIYNMLNKPDSALVYLESARTIAEPYKSKMDLANLYNNIGNVYIKKHNFSKAIGYFQQNKLDHELSNEKTDLWSDYLNLADTYIGLKKFDSAQLYAFKSLDVAKKLTSRNKEAGSYAVLAKLYKESKNFQQAFEYQQKWYQLDTSLVNTETNNNIAELQEKYNAIEREHENNLLQSQVVAEKLKHKIYIYLVIAAGLVILVVSFAFLEKRNSNQKLEKVNTTIMKQNEKLAELNQEKNSLISIVSHDLNTPFSSIKIWTQLLEGDKKNLTSDQQKAIDRIYQSAEKGELLINNILIVEKAGLQNEKIVLESFDFPDFIKYQIENIRPIVATKNIRLHFESNWEDITILCDKSYMQRIFENLVTNAVKYSQPGKNIWVNVDQDENAVFLTVKDEGIGISEKEIMQLFSRYGTVSSKPTSGESSTGLGLYIVKRLAEELNGSVVCKSKIGVGSEFTVALTK
ncbi:tetratricopeptide repeat-containing sensor histidine kinase [Pinibacter soli]|uniref:histidine kinase n=1 Tax=Pinibacter soli TaxID=3044211 RepID=A0ABT6R933_9BACT|nr:tetratricopeptide repeat-containing sensor histidine kinase [Pinibacter soli]MDI3318404.1 tetratricopeptide repeat-containing sensor histidine kinase [Pinibacter soli]